MDFLLVIIISFVIGRLISAIAINNQRDNKRIDSSYPSDEKISEMIDYVKTHMRPFSLWDWLTYQAHTYVLMPQIVHFFLYYIILNIIWGTLFLFDIHISYIWFAVAILLTDYDIYRKSRMAEIMCDDTTFQIKYGKIFEKLINKKI